MIKTHISTNVRTYMYNYRNMHAHTYNHTEQYLETSVHLTTTRYIFKSKNSKYVLKNLSFYTHFLFFHHFIQHLSLFNDIFLEF